MHPRSPAASRPTALLAVVATALAALVALAAPAGAGAPLEPRPAVDAADVGELAVGADGALWSVRSTAPLSLHRIDATGAERTVTVAGTSGEPADLAAGLGSDPIWVALGDRVVRIAADGTASSVAMPAGTSVAALEPDAARERMWFVATDAQPADGATVGRIDAAGQVTSRSTTVPIYADAELVRGPGDAMWSWTGREVGSLARIDADLAVEVVDGTGTLTGTPVLGADGLLHVPAIGDAVRPLLVRVGADGGVASTVGLPSEGGEAVVGPDGATYVSADRGYHRVRLDGQVRSLLASPTGAPVAIGSPGESVAFDGDLWYVGVDGFEAGVLRLDDRPVPVVEAASEGAPAPDGRVTVAVTVAGDARVPTGTVTVVELRCCSDGAAQAAPIGSARLDARGEARIVVVASERATGYWVDYGGDATYVGTTSVQAPYLDPGGEVGRYVNQVYADLLRRAPEQAGFDYWSVQLLERAPRSAVANALAISTEHRLRVVERLFREHLERPADPAGRDAFVRDLVGGATIHKVRASILGSREFFERFAGGTVDGYLSAVYEEVLGRAPDAAGRAYWRGQLDAGVSRPTMASALLGSEEALERLVTGYFADLLRRQVDAGGREYWADLLQAGFREERLVAELIGSEEYYRAAVAGRY